MIFEVEMWAFDGGKIKSVKVPDADIKRCKKVEAALEVIFANGQKEGQSISVGDVIRYDGKRWRVLGLGFKEITEDPGPLTKREWIDLMTGGLIGKL
jgi:hypothetical protein